MKMQEFNFLLNKIREKGISQLKLADMRVLVSKTSMSMEFYNGKIGHGWTDYWYKGTHY